jgi:hypothetical protein
MKYVNSEDELYYGVNKDVDKLIESCMKNIGLREYKVCDRELDEEGVVKSVNLLYVNDDNEVYDLEDGEEDEDCYGEYVFNFFISKVDLG